MLLFILSALIAVIMFFLGLKELTLLFGALAGGFMASVVNKKFQGRRKKSYYTGGI